MQPSRSQSGAGAPGDADKRKRRRRRPAWSLAEELTLAKQHAEHGNAWIRIAQSLPGRSAAEVKNIYYSTLRATRTRKRSVLRAYVAAVRGHEDDPEARRRALVAAEARDRALAAAEARRRALREAEDPVAPGEQHAGQDGTPLCHYNYEHEQSQPHQYQQQSYVHRLPQESRRPLAAAITSSPPANTTGVHSVPLVASLSACCGSPAEAGAPEWQDAPAGGTDGNHHLRQLKHWQQHGSLPAPVVVGEPRCPAASGRSVSLYWSAAAGDGSSRSSGGPPGLAGVLAGSVVSSVSDGGGSGPKQRWKLQRQRQQRRDSTCWSPAALNNGSALLEAAPDGASNGDLSPAAGERSRSLNPSASGPLRPLTSKDSGTSGEPATPCPWPSPHAPRTSPSGGSTRTGATAGAVAAQEPAGGPSWPPDDLAVDELVERAWLRPAAASNAHPSLSAAGTSWPSRGTPGAPSASLKASSSAPASRPPASGGAVVPSYRSGGDICLLQPQPQPQLHCGACGGCGHCRGQQVACPHAAVAGDAALDRPWLCAGDERRQQRNVGQHRRAGGEAAESSVASLDRFHTTTTAASELDWWRRHTSVRTGASGLAACEVLACSPAAAAAAAAVAAAQTTAAGAAGSPSCCLPSTSPAVATQQKEGRWPPETTSRTSYQEHCCPANLREPAPEHRPPSPSRCLGLLGPACATTMTTEAEARPTAPGSLSDGSMVAGTPSLPCALTPATTPLLETAGALPPLRLLAEFGSSIGSSSSCFSSSMGGGERHLRLGRLLTSPLLGGDGGNEDGGKVCCSSSQLEMMFYLCDDRRGERLLLQDGAAGAGWGSRLGEANMPLTKQSLHW